MSGLLRSPLPQPGFSSGIPLGMPDPSRGEWLLALCKGEKFSHPVRTFPTAPSLAPFRARIRTETTGRNGAWPEISTSRNPAPASRDSHSASSQTPPSEAFHAWGSWAISTGNSPSRISSRAARRPPGFNMRCASASAFFLSTVRLNEALANTIRRRYRPQGGCSPCPRPAGAVARCYGFPQAPRARGEASGARCPARRAWRPHRASRSRGARPAPRRIRAPRPSARLSDRLHRADTRSRNTRPKRARGVRRYKRRDTLRSRALFRAAFGKGIGFGQMGVSISDVGFYLAFPRPRLRALNGYGHGALGGAWAPGRRRILTSPLPS